MKMARYREPQILAILRQAEGGVPVPPRKVRTARDRTTSCVEFR